MLKENIATLSKVYIGKYNKKSKTNTAAFLFDNICAVLTTICVIALFCGTIQEYFPTWTGTVHLPKKLSGYIPWLCHLTRDIISALVNAYIWVPEHGIIKRGSFVVMSYLRA